MSNVNNQFKELINEAIDNSFHNNIEMKIILKEWLYGICEKADEYEAKAKAYDRVAEKLYARINHIIMTSNPAQGKPGYVDGLYNALDIISADLESGVSDD